MTPYETTVNDYKLTCFYEYDPAQEADEINPAWRAMVTITKVFINDSKEDAYQLLNPALIQNLEDEILEALE